MLNHISKAFSSKLGGVTGISPHKVQFEHKLSELTNHFQDGELVKALLSRGENPKIYEVYEIPQPAIKGSLNVGCTILHPGKVGNEYYFTKGHFHQRESTSEVYLGLEGEGLILIQDRMGKATGIEIKSDILVYIPPNTAHRSVNTGKNRLVFLAVYPSDAGHDYESIERTGFSKIVVESDGKPVIEPNPKYHKS